MLLNAILQVQEGEEPSNIVRKLADNAYEHLVAIQEVFPGSVDWHDVWKQRLATA